MTIRVQCPVIDEVQIIDWRANHPLTDMCMRNQFSEPWRRQNVVNIILIKKLDLPFIKSQGKNIKIQELRVQSSRAKDYEANVIN